MKNCKSNSLFRFGASVVSLALLSTVLMGGCPGFSELPKASDVRYVNMASHGQMANSTLTFDTNFIGKVDQYSKSFYTGQSPKKAVAMITDKDGNAVCNVPDFECPSDSYVSMISLGSDTNVELVKVSRYHDSLYPGAGEFKVTFVNGVEQAFGVDVYVLNVGAPVSGTPAVSGITYTEDAAATVTLTGTTKDFVACFHGTTTEMFRTTVTLSGGDEFLSVLVSPTGLPGSFKTMNFVTE